MMGRRGTGGITAALLLLVILGLLPVEAASAAPGPTSRVTLRGTNVVVGSRSGSIAVRLPRATRINSNSDIRSTSGRGRIVGLAIRQDGPWSEFRPMAMHAWFGDCPDPGCPTVFRYHSTEATITPDGDGFEGTFPAGNYHIFLVADAASVKVTLTLRGLRGRTTLRPSGPIRASIVEPEPTMAFPDSPASLHSSLYSAGSTRTLGRGGGVSVGNFWKQVLLPGQASAVNVCYYVGRPPGDAQPAPYQMPCNGPFLSGTRTPGGNPYAVDKPRYTGLTYWWALPPGTHSLGGYINTAGPIISAHIQQLWLEFTF